MVRDGFVDEVRGLLDRGYSRGLPSMSGIGYGEMCEYIAGETSLESAIKRTKTGTHRLARHQNSWFKAGDERIRWVEGESYEESITRAEAFVDSGVRAQP